jgi:2-iminobutanoate/2-iminopropanoate deaminase
MSKITPVVTTNAPLPISSYSQALIVSSPMPLLFTSGQIAIDPATGTLVEGGILKETLQVLRNIESILNAANTTWQSVIRVEIFLINLDEHFHVVNSEYIKKFSTAAHMPVRQTVGVSQLPQGALIEISCIATVDSN